MAVSYTHLLSRSGGGQSFAKGPAPAAPQTRAGAVSYTHLIRICTLFDKPERREVEVRPTYVGAQIPDAFIVGYGLDYDERYRNLPFVGVLKPSVYE